MQARISIAIASALVLALLVIGLSGKKHLLSSTTDVPTGSVSVSNGHGPSSGTSTAETLTDMDSETVNASAPILPNWGQPKFKRPSVMLSNARKPIDMVAAEGTRLHFPANAFVDADGRPVKGEVRIEVQEYYELTDFLRARLHTLSDQGLLQSGGTVKVKVTADGMPVQLAPGVEYDLGFQVNDMVTGMLPWRMDTLTMEWVEAGDADLTTMEWDPYDFYNATGSYNLDSAYFMNGDQGWDDFLNIRQRYPEDAQAQGIEGEASFKIFIGADGRVNRVDPLDYDFPSFAYEGVRLLRTAVFAPAINYTSQGFASTKTVTLQFPNKFTHDFRYKDEFVRQFDADYASFQKKPHRDEKHWRDLIYRTEQAFKEKNLTGRGRIDGKGGKKTTRRIVMPATTLGWVNCDFLLRLNNPQRITQRVEFTEAEQAASLYYLVFAEYQALVPEDGLWAPGSLRNGACFHSAVPGMKAILVRIVNDEDGNVLVAYSPIITGEACEAPTDLMPIHQLTGVLGPIFNPNGGSCKSSLDWETPVAAN